ncbi:hypothetical protein ACQ4PT_046113 [Festuca glaucescens]
MEPGKRESWRTTMLLAYQSLGVVYGDLSISPLYVYKSTFADDITHSDTNEEILGVLSFVFWTLTLIRSSSTSPSSSAPTTTARAEPSRSTPSSAGTPTSACSPTARSPTRSSPPTGSSTRRRPPPATGPASRTGSRCTGASRPRCSSWS